MRDSWQKPIKGRGALENPAGRFERLETFAERDEPAPDEEEDPGPNHATAFYRDPSRRILSRNDSPDVGFSTTLNPYRGCEHGCIYCYARPTHEFLGLSAGLDFETKIFVKENAPQLLRKALDAPGWVPQVIGLSGVTDAYQPAERRLRVTRGCLEVLAEYGNPVSIVTKNRLVTRDIDLLARLAARGAAQVFVSITTLDAALARILEPRTSQPKLRLQTVRELNAAGIPVGVLMAPIIPGLTDHEIPTLLEAAAEAGAWQAGYTILRLPYGVKDLFVGWLEEHRPDRKMKILNRIRAMRDGALNVSEFGARMSGKGIFAETIAALFAQSRMRHGLDRSMPPLSTAAFRRPTAQRSLFDQ